MDNVNKLSDYNWSSFPEYVSDLQYEICNKELILSNFKSRIAYKEFIFDNAEYQKNLESIKHLNFD